MGQQYKLFEESIHRHRTENVIRILDEAYGSYPGQFKSVVCVAREIVDMANIGNFDTTDGDCHVIKIERYIDGIGNVLFIVKWFERKYGDTVVRGVKSVDGNKTSVELVVYAGQIVYYNLASTIAHELMHCFQGGLRKVNGVSERSMFLYNKLLEFYNNAPFRYSEYFFYGLYICYSIEVSANVSSVANYMEGYFKDRNTDSISTVELENALRRFDKYDQYVRVYHELEGVSANSFYEDDLEYIKKCMCGEFRFGDQSMYLYDSGTFNVRKFVDSNLKKIVRVCGETIFKMRKNIMEFVENNSVKQ